MNSSSFSKQWDASATWDYLIERGESGYAKASFSGFPNISVRLIRFKGKVDEDQKGGESSRSLWMPSMKVSSTSNPN